MTDLFTKKDNEFIAWYPLGLTREAAEAVWEPKRAAYYVHIPFCSAICDYCAFAVARSHGADIRRYLDALTSEIRRYAERERLADHRFDCGHFGGGTPSVIEAADLVALKALIHSSFDVAPDAEISVEVNPISFTLDKAKAYREAGVNRISLGVQSFNERTLHTIGRPHRTGDIDAALSTVRGASFDNFSLDIMYGAPGQTLEELHDDLVRAVETGARHLSCFRLEIIPFTALKLREGANLLPPRISETLFNEMDDLVSSVLTENGLRRYGAFNFARPGYESVYNSIAFMAPQGDYVGFGNSSYSFINRHVYCNYADIPSYEAAVFDGRDPISFARRVNALEAMSRYFVLGVKFFRVSRAAFIADFGLEPEDVFGEVLTRLLAAGMLTREEDEYVLTEVGRHYVNNVCKEFYVGESRGMRQYVQFVPTLTAGQIENLARRAVPATNTAASAGA